MGTVPAERPDDLDEEFNAIVARLGPGWSSGLPAWPDAPDVETGRHDDEDVTAVRDVGDVGDAAGRAAPSSSAGAEPTGERAAKKPADEHYEPPPPPPLPVPEPVTALCWLLVIGAPVLLVVVSLAGWYVPRWALAAVALGFAGGVVTLVARLDDGPRDTDNGAVV